MTSRLRVVVATPLEPELCDLLTEREPRIDLVVEQDLLPPMRWAGDHEGDPDFRRTPEQQARFEELVHSAEALYGIPDTDPALLAETVRRNPKLRWVQTMAAGGGAQVKAAGLEQADLDRIKWTTSAGAHSRTLTEWALFGVLAGAKELPRLQKLQAERSWPTRWPMKQVFDMRICVVGLGHIGRGIAQAFTALGAEVVGVRSHPQPTEGAVEVYGTDQVLEAVTDCDAIVAAVPGTSASAGMIGAAELAAAKPCVIIANVGRGNAIDEPALIEALHSGQVSFAALDVTAVEPLPADSELWSFPQVVIAPHTAALHAEEDRLIAELFAENAGRLLDGVELRNRVDTVQFY